MPTQIFTATLFATMGGRNAVDQFTNKIDFRSAEAPGAVNHRAIAGRLAEAFAAIMVARARIMRVTITPRAADGSTANLRGQHVTVNVDEVGLRVLAPNVDPAILNYVAIFTKNGALGYAGKLFVRGTFSEDEVKSSSDLNPTTVPGFDATVFTGFANNLPSIFADNGAELILPAPADGNFVDDARAVVDVVYQGVGLKQRRNNRKSLSQAQREVAEREVNAIAAQYEEELRRAGSAPQVPQAVVNFIVGLLVAVIQKYGAVVISKLPIPFYLRPILTLALAVI
jgi:hypothetical protein